MQSVGVATNVHTKLVLFDSFGNRSRKICSLSTNSKLKLGDDLARRFQHTLSLALTYSLSSS